MNMLTYLAPVTLGVAADNAPGQCAVANLGRGRWSVIWLDPAGRIVESTGASGEVKWSKPTLFLSDPAAGGFKTLSISGDDRTGWRLTAGKPGITRAWHRRTGNDEWVPEPEVVPAAPSVAPTGLPDGVLAWTGDEGSRFVARSGRRVPGVKPRFPSAGLVLAVEECGDWRDLGFADEAPDAEVRSATLAANGTHLLAAYVIMEQDGSTVCRLVQLPLKTTTAPVPSWRKLPAFPQAPGMAGPMSGHHNGALIVAGGTNWPEPGKRKWYDEIHVLVDGEEVWRSGGRLPSPRAYGAAVSLPDGVLIMGGDGGNAEDQICHDALFLAWDGQQVRIRPAPALPAAVSNPMAAVWDGSVYLAGGNSGSPRLSRNDFWRLDLSNPDAGWQPLPTWPGPARSHAVMAALNGAIYLLSGLDTHIGTEGKPESVYLSDGFRFVSKENVWEKLPDLPWSAIAAPSPAPVTTSPARVFVLGGVDGRQAGKLPPTTRVPEDVMYFDVAAHAWRLWPERWPGSAVTIPAVKSGSEWLFVSGETMSGVRTTEVWSWKIGEDSP